MSIIKSKNGNLLNSFLFFSLLISLSAFNHSMSRPITDSDSDGVADSQDQCPGTPIGIEVDQSGCPIEDVDTDGDGWIDSQDLFPNDATEWADLDGDGVGDNSDLDRDGDGISNDFEIELNTDPNNAADTPDDLDGDSVPDALDEDIDGDGVNNSDDQFPSDPNENADMDGDGIGDNTDPDRDGDGIPNTLDFFPNDSSEWADMDGDGVGDNSDPDVDGDGVPNIEDAFPFDPSETLDFDGDGIGDNADTDRDGDGVANGGDSCPNTSIGAVVHENGCEVSGQDTDQDGVFDEVDHCPSTELGELVDQYGCSESQPNNDTDGDGIPDGLDEDDDNDGYSDLMEEEEGTDPLDTESRPGSIYPVIATSLVPKTGAITSYMAFDDGDLKSGVGRNYSRDDETQIVTDHISGLKWQDTSDSQNLTLGWQDASSYCNDSELGGITDWRLPTETEMIFTANMNRVGQQIGDPGLEPAFMYGADAYYWTFPRFQYGIDDEFITANPSVPKYLRSDAGDLLNFRCVSGDERESPVMRRIGDPVSGDNTNFVVIDIANQLMWQDTPDIADNLFIWEEAVEYCSNLNIHGLDDWRLPNTHEAHSMVYKFFGQTNRYFRSGPDTNDPRYWLSTTDDASPGNAHSITIASWQYNSYSHPKSQDFYARCVRDFHEPVVISGGDRVVNTNEEVVFDGSRSFGNDDGDLTYYWDAESDSTYFNSRLIFPVSNRNDAVVTMANVPRGEHRVSLRVTDQYGNRNYHYYDLIVEGENQPPVADAGNNYTTTYGREITLQSRNSSDDWKIVSYEWTLQGETLGTSNPTRLYLPIGLHEIELTVTDNDGATDTDTVVITVNPVAGNMPPVANAGEGGTYPEGAEIVLDGSLSADPDGSIASYQWSYEGNNYANTATVTIQGLSAGTYTFELEVTDNHGESDTDTVTFVVSASGGGLVANAGADITILEGESVYLDGSNSSDSNGHIETYQWLDSNSYLISEGVTAEISNLPAGEFDYTLIITDNDGNQALDVVQVNVTPYNPLSACSLPDVTDDSRFIDTYPDNDIPWIGLNYSDVEEIERGFNHARRNDKSVENYLSLPAQNVWDNMSYIDKGMYLMNAERHARGLKPFSGTSYSVSLVAHNYANYIVGNNLIVGHYLNDSTPDSRIDSVSNNRSRDGNIKYESIAATYDSEQEIDRNAFIVEAIYMWIYLDKEPFGGAPWSHRDHLLQADLLENHGVDSTEGVAGFGIVTGSYDPFADGANPYGAVAVLNTIDQSSSYTYRVDNVDISASHACNNRGIINITESEIPTPDSITKLNIISSTTKLLVGGNAELSVLAAYLDGSTQDITSYTNFSFDSRSIVSIESGIVTARNTGSVTVQAELNGIYSNPLTIHVGEPVDKNNLIGTSAEELTQHIPENASISAYDPQFISVYTGTVSDRNGTGLSGVTVSFNNEPELGSTVTDEEGRYIIAAPSGKRVVLFEKHGFLTIQRKSVGASTAWSNVEDVILLREDTKRTHINLVSGDLQVHESSIVSDEFGTRKTTVVFNNITSATVLSPDGTERQLNDFWMTATEYEMPESMPGELDGHSVFTHCVELKVEGTAFNESVIFNNDVVTFVENFLGFEVGEIIPVGYFDTINSAWIPIENGVVVRLLDANDDGIVDGVDYNDDGMADDLNENGLTADDALGLENYSAGETLWWSKSNHFSAKDQNQSGTGSEGDREVDGEGDGEEGDNNEETCTGSYVQPYQQSFHEDISIAGTDLTLHYSSQRTKDYKHKVEIKVSGAELPVDVTRMIARLEIAGREFETEFLPAENLTAEFIWDGLDLLGQRPSGRVNGVIRVGYEYPSNFASVGNLSQTDQLPSDFPPAFDVQGGIDTGIPTRETFVSWKGKGISIQNTFESQVAEGWSLSNVHESNSTGQIYLGYGKVDDIIPLSNVTKTGQTISYVEGDDGFYQAGGTDIRYVNDIDNLVLDENTELHWTVGDESTRTYSKDYALSYCGEANFGGFNDWRLPTEKERGYSLTKSSSWSGHDYFDPFIDVWTETRVETGRYYDIFCVRGDRLDDRYGQSLERNSTQSTVTDTDNALMWQDVTDNASSTMNWEQSIQYCENLNHAGFDNWRLPNANELLYSLPNTVFTHQTQLDIPDGETWAYDSEYRKAYWTSTSHFNSQERAWAVESNGFNSNNFLKEDDLYVRCVRDDTSVMRSPYAFDENGRHLKTYDVPSATVESELNYDLEGKLVSIIDRFGNTLTLNRNAQGKVSSIVTQDGQITVLSYDSDNNLTSVAYDDGSSYQFDYEGSLLLTKTEPNGNRFYHVFDENGRVTQTSNDEEGQWDFFDVASGYNNNRYGYSTAEGNQYQTIRTILENGDVQKSTTGVDGIITVSTIQSDDLKETIADYTGTTVTDFERDSRTKQLNVQRVTTTKPSGLSSASTISKRYLDEGASNTSFALTINDNNRISTLVNNTATGINTLTSPEGRIFTSQVNLLTQQLMRSGRQGLEASTYTYDDRGRTASVTIGERITQYSYDEDTGFLNSVTTPDGLSTQYEYDELGRTTQVTYPDGNSIRNQYDENGNLTSLIVPTENTHSFTHNGVNKVGENRTPLNEVTKYHYDKDRRLKTITLPSGQTITNQYEAGKLSKTIRPESETDYSYINGGQLVGITDGIEQLSYGYDGDLLTTINYRGELEATIQFTYGDNFWLTNLAYADSSSALAYDDDGLLTAINGYTITRNAQHGLPESVSDSKYTQDLTHNTYGEWDEITQKVSDKPTYDYSLTYNLLGQITGKSETLSDGTVNQYIYGYDSKLRLIEVKKNQQVIEQYSYDANGNRISSTNVLIGTSNQTATYNAGDQLQSDGNTQYEYDGNGRLSRKTLGDSITTYQYSSDGKLLSVNNGEQSITYQHNAFGNRVAKLINGEVVEKYLWLNKTTLLATYDQDNNLKQRFEYTLGHTPTSYTQAGQKYYISTDHLGSPRVISDANGNTLKTIEYDSFGNVISDTNSNLQIPFGFAGGLYDTDTQLIRFGYRDYDPQTGRWTARDPIGFAGGDSNLYGYTASNPLNWTDSTGLDVTITLYEGAGGFGHIGIGVNSNQTSGFYPADSANPLNIVTGSNVPGVRKVDTANPIDSFTIKTTKDQDRIVKDLIRDSFSNPEDYNLYGGGGGSSNCATNAGDILNGAGIPASPSFLPKKFFKTL